MSGAVAAVDCGTNSTRLLVAGRDGTSLDRRMTITRLGQGVDRTGTLAADAVARTVEVLRSYRLIMDDHDVASVRAIATSAARDATNRDDFFAAAEAALGAPLELLTGDEEARLSFAGAAAGLERDGGPWLVADIGGGSTELAVGRAGSEPEAVVSLDVGCVRVTERYLAHDPPERAETDRARAEVRALVRATLDDRPALARTSRMVGLAGTVSAAAALDLRLDAYDRSKVHHHRLAATTVRSLLDELAALDEEGRRARPGMEQARAGVIVGGLVVLDALLDTLGLDACLVSESDILDGLVMTLLLTDR